MTRRLISVCLAAALGACHYRSHVNAPGVIQLERPPAQPTREAMEEPASPPDRGEYVVSLSSGILFGPGVTARRTLGDLLAVETTLNWGKNKVSDDTPESAFRLAEQGYGVTLGWAPLRAVKDDEGNKDMQSGTIYVEAQRFWRNDFVLYMGVGAGWAVLPHTGDHGPQVNVWWTGPFFARARYFLDGGAEVYIGFQLKYPATYAWSR